MIKKTLLGCVVLVVLAAVGGTLLVGFDWSAIGTAAEGANGDEELGLERRLASEFGGQPAVEFVCRLPVVGEAPCLPAEAGGRREVTLTFSGYRPPSGIDPREHARRIAVVAAEGSTFVERSHKTVVVFQEGDESASVLRRYTFTARELAPGPEPGSGGEAI